MCLLGAHREWTDDHALVCWLLTPLLRPGHLLVPGSGLYLVYALCGEETTKGNPRSA